MISSRFSLQFGWYLSSLVILTAIWVLSLGPGLYESSPFAPYRIYFPPASTDLSALMDQIPASHEESEGSDLNGPLPLQTEADSLKQMAIYSVEMTRKYSWNYQLFTAICHSRPERSIFLNGIQMPVNSRCSGIFSGLFFGILLIPLVGHRFYRKKWVVSLLSLMVILQIVDVTGNSLGWWVNSVASRLLLGFPLGLFLILAITDLFVQPRSTNVRG